MKASLILAHPYKKSFNHAMYRTMQKTLKDCRVEVFAHDLYRERFNPVLSVGELGKRPSRDRKVNRLVGELIDSDLLIFIHPNWWGQPPAILTGYIDRVIRPPHAYDFSPEEGGGGLPTGKLGGKVGLVFNTANTPKDREDYYFNDPLESIWGKCVFGFTGIEHYLRQVFRVMADSTIEQRKRWLQEAADTVYAAIESMIAGSKTGN